MVVAAVMVQERSMLHRVMERRWARPQMTKVPVAHHHRVAFSESWSEFFGFPSGNLSRAPVRLVQFLKEDKVNNTQYEE